MADNESFEALRVDNPKPPEEEEEEEEDEEEEELEESEDGEEDEEDEARVGDLQAGEFRGSGTLKTLAAPSSRQLSENGQCAGRLFCFLLLNIFFLFGKKICFVLVEL
jgi:hypothetical protein